MKNLTERQKEICKLYENFVHSYREIPQYKDVARALDITTASLFETIDLLKKKVFFILFFIVHIVGKRYILKNNQTYENR